jgi:hypothetical protein
MCLDPAVFHTAVGPLVTGRIVAVVNVDTPLKGDPGAAGRGGEGCALGGMCAGRGDQDTHRRVSRSADQAAPARRRRVIRSGLDRTVLGFGAMGVLAVFLVVQIPRWRKVTTATTSQHPSPDTQRSPLGVAKGKQTLCNCVITFRLWTSFCATPAGMAKCSPKRCPGVRDPHPSFLVAAWASSQGLGRPKTGATFAYSCGSGVREFSK